MASRLGLILLVINTEWSFSTIARHTKLLADALATYTDYRGCYVEIPPKYNFFWWPRVWDGNNKVQCIDKCYAQDFFFAAINNRDDCYCGNGYLDTYGTSQNCYNATINRVPSTVGNRMSSAVYATGRRLSQKPLVDERYIGCWRGKTGIFGSHFVAIAKGDNRMTVDRCINWCHNQTHMYSVLSVGTNCYCGNSLHYGGQVQPTESATCRSPCSGSLGESCGSNSDGNIVAVYRAIPKTCRDGYFGILCKQKCQCSGYPCNRDTGKCLKKCTVGSTLPQCRIDDDKFSCHSCAWANTSFIRSSDLQFLQRFFPNNARHDSMCGDPFPVFTYNGSSCANASYCVKFNFTVNKVHYLVRECLRIDDFSCTPFQNQLQSVAENAGASNLSFACCRGSFCNSAPGDKTEELILFPILLSWAIITTMLLG